MFEKTIGRIKRGISKITGSASKPKAAAPAKKPSNVRQQAKTKQAASKNDLVNKNKNLNARIKHTTKKDAPKFKKAVNLGLKALDIIDRPRNALMNAMDDSKRGENTFKEGFKEGWTGKERVDGGELLKRKNVDTRVAKGLTKLGVKSKTANSIGKGVNAVGGVAVDILTDPLNAVTLGGGSLAKGALTGVGGSLTKEAMEKGAKTAGKHLLRTQGKKVITRDIAEKALTKHKPAIDTVNRKTFNKSLEDMVKHGGSSLHKATPEYKAAKAVYDDMANSVAKNSGVDLQKMVNRQTGRGVSVLGKEVVSANKMRDIGAKIHKATIGKTQLGKQISEGVNESFIRGYKPGMNMSDLTLTRLIDQNQRGLQEKLLTDHVDKVKKISKGTSKKQDKSIARALDTGKAVDGKGAKELDDYKQLLDEVADQEIAHNLLGKKKGAYLPHVKSLKHEAAAPWKKAAKLKLSGITNSSKQFGKSYNPYSNTRKLDMPVGQANDILEKEHGVKDYFETSAAKAVAQRSVSSAKNIANKTAIDDVLETFGQRVSHPNDLGAAAATHAVVVPKQQIAGMVIDPESGTTIGNILEQADELMRTNGMDSRAAVRQVIGTLPPKQYPVKEIEGVLSKLYTNEQVIDLVANKDLVNDLSILQQIYGTGPDFYAVPKNVIDQFVKPGDTTGVAAKGLAYAADAFNYAWKPLKTKYSAPYHVRNAIGGNVSMAADLGFKALDPTVMAKAEIVKSGADDAVVKLGGRSYSVGELRNYLTSNNILASTYHRGDLNTIAKQLDNELSRGTDMKLISRLADSVGNSIEENLRTRHFLGALDKGLDPLTAATSVRKYQIDYQDLTDWEKNVMRRVQAFYTFSSKNLPLQAANFLDKPSGALENAYRLSEETQEQYGVDPTHIPDYMATQLPMWFGQDQYGQPMNLNASLPQTEPLGWLPNTENMFTTEGLMTPVRQFIDKVNPLIKGGVELSKGINLFTGREMEESERNLLSYGLNMFNPVNFLEYGDEAKYAGKARQPHLNTAGITSSYNKDAAEVGTLYDRNEQLTKFKEALNATGQYVPSITDIRKSQGYKANNKYTPLDQYAYKQEVGDLGITKVDGVNGGAVKQYAKDKSKGKILKTAETPYEVQLLREFIEKLKKNRG